MYIYIPCIELLQQTHLISQCHLWIRHSGLTYESAASHKWKRIYIYIVADLRNKRMCHVTYGCVMSHMDGSCHTKWCTNLNIYVYIVSEFPAINTFDCRTIWYGSNFIFFALNHQNTVNAKTIEPPTKIWNNPKTIFVLLSKHCRKDYRKNAGQSWYGVATISRLLKIIHLSCRISSLL